MRKIKFLLFVVILFSFGCAHKIAIKPDLKNMYSNNIGSFKRINAVVGYYIPENVKNIEVVTSGGGGDRVKYYPYKEIEEGFQAMLSTVFSGVTKVEAINQAYSSNGATIQYIITPHIMTTSSSSSFFTWPPTNFSVDLISKITNSSGREINSTHVIGYGNVAFSEMRGDFGLAGRRAMEDALLKTQSALRKIDYDKF